MKEKQNVSQEENNEQRTVCPEIEGDRYTWFYVCGDCHGQINWHDEVCRHCKARLDWNG